MPLIGRKIFSEMNMQKKTIIFVILLAIGLGLFVLFWFPNSTGARDLNMTYIFESDEPAQYTHPMRMLTPGKTWNQTLYRFFAYQHYYYGFPYYFYSAVFVLLPLKLAAGLGNISLNFLFLRQFVSVLPMIAAMLLLVYLQTGFQSYLKSIVLFLLLFSVPEVVTNSLWYHPEALVLLLIGLTFFFLVRDDLKFGRDFYLSAFFCGLTVATKLVGLFFFLAIPYYLFLGWRQKKIDLRRAFIVAAQFVAIMVAIFILANPFLFWASERNFAWKTQTDLHNSLGGGFIVTYQADPLRWYNVAVQNFATPAFLLLATASVAIGAFTGTRRLLNQLIIFWAAPFAIYISVALAIRASHFPMPILLPVFSSLPAYFTFFTLPRPTGPWLAYFKTNWLRLAMLAVGLIVVAAQFSFSLSKDIPLYVSTLNREKNNPSLQFYDELDANYLSRITLDRQLIVFRDVEIYFPNSSRYDIHFKWGVSNYYTIQKVNPDLLVLSKQHLYDYTQENLQGRDPDFALTYEFYKDALNGTVNGFTLLYQNDFGIAYISTPLYQQFFASR